MDESNTYVIFNEGWFNPIYPRRFIVAVCIDSSLNFLDCNLLIELDGESTSGLVDGSTVVPVVSFMLEDTFGLSSF